MNSRRRFIHHSLLLCSSLSLPLQAQSYARSVKILREPYQTMALLYDDLFPPSNNIPGARELNTIAYMRGVLQDERIPQERKTYLFNGVKWLDEESITGYGKKYFNLHSDQRSAILDSISKEYWGGSWLYFLMEYFFESMFCDPVYGANIDQKGWRWLNLEPGYPRPSRALS